MKFFPGGKGARGSFRLKTKFQSQTHPEPEPSGLQEWDSHLRKRRSRQLPLSKNSLNLLLQFPPLPQSLQVSGERERCLESRIPLIVHLSSFLIAAPHFALSGSSTHFYPPPRARVGASKGSSYLSPYVGTGLFSLKIELPPQDLNPRLSIRYLLGRFLPIQTQPGHFKLPQAIQVEGLPLADDQSTWKSNLRTLP